MNPIVYFAVSSSAHALVLALLVWVVARFCRSAEVATWLWLIVLVKLVTPPIVTMPMPGLSSLSENEFGNVQIEPSLSNSASRVPVAKSIGAVRTDDVSTTEPVTLPNETFTNPIHWSHIVLVLWAIGSLIYVAVSLIRIHRFGKQLRFEAVESTNLQQNAINVASRMGITTCPDVKTVDCRIPPLLWAFRSSTEIVIPSQLVQNLTAVQRKMLIAHELAHYARKDHLVRMFGLLMMSIYWWNPIVWWINRELHESQEQCCDAWVSRLFPQDQRSYASCLLEAVDFSSNMPITRLSTAFGSSANLKRRLRMLKLHRTRFVPAWRTKLALGLIALMTLPLAAQLRKEDKLPDSVKATAKLGDAAKTLDALLEIRKQNHERLKSFSIYWNHKHEGFGKHESSVGDGFDSDDLIGGGGVTGVGGQYRLAVEGGKVMSTSLNELADKSSFQLKHVYDGKFWYFISPEKPKLIGVATEKDGGPAVHGLDWFMVTGWPKGAWAPDLIKTVGKIEWTREQIREKKAELLECSVQGRFCIAKTRHESGMLATTFRFDLTKGGCLVESVKHLTNGKLWDRTRHEISEVADGLWMPSKVSQESFDKETSELTIRNSWMLDLERSEFNSRLDHHTFMVKLDPSMTIRDHRFQPPESYAGRSSLLPLDRVR